MRRRPRNGSLAGKAQGFRGYLMGIMVGRSYSERPIRGDQRYLHILGVMVFLGGFLGCSGSDDQQTREAEKEAVKNQSEIKNNESTVALGSKCEDKDISDPVPCCKCENVTQNKWEDVEPSGLAPCCKCDNVGPSEEVICLSVKQMRDHVDHIEPIKTPGLMNGRGRGILRLAILFDSTGRASSIRWKCGSPLLTGVAIEAIRKWTFKPVLANGVKKAGCGIITIKYRVGYPDPLNENFTELQ